MGTTLHFRLFYTFMTRFASLSCETARINRASEAKRNSTPPRRNQQLVTALSSGQQLTEHHQNTLILNGNDTHLVALALYSEGVFSQCPFRCRCVYAEALVDTKSCIAPKVEGKLESFCRRYSSAG